MASWNRSAECSRGGKPEDSCWYILLSTCRIKTCKNTLLYVLALPLLPEQSIVLKSCLKLRFFFVCFLSSSSVTSTHNRFLSTICGNFKQNICVTVSHFIQKLFYTKHNEWSLHKGLYHSPLIVLGKTNNSFDFPKCCVVDVYCCIHEIW